MSNADSTYNGWANYETWNVALWIGNDAGLYAMAKAYKRDTKPYESFVEDLKDLGAGDTRFQTPDGVAWNDSGLDVEALDELIREL